MTVILVDLADENHDIQINWWNWRPILTILYEAKLIDDEQFERMGANGCGGKMTSEQARMAASFLKQRIVSWLSDGERIHANGEISSAPTELRPISSLSPQQLYATQKSCLETFVAFCDTSQGFEVL